VTDTLNPLLAYAAGVLTILSPCVLPLVPIVLASAAQRHRLGPLALCLGLIVSFTIVGMAVATAGSGVLADPEVLRVTGAAMMGIVGAILLSNPAQQKLAALAAPLANWAQQRQSGLVKWGLTGQFGIGLLLGLIWIPCVGPTLGAATVLAAQGERLGEVAAIMIAYAGGIASVLLAIAAAAQGFLKRRTASTLKFAARAKSLLGIALLAIAVLVLTGADHLIEGAILSVMPEQMIDWTTKL
jgi:cytochrome c-type biogenesis protein